MIKPTKARSRYTQHELKVHPEPFEALWNGKKTCEFRLNDRNYELDDTLVLKEYNPVLKSYTGRQVIRYITHIQTGFGIPDGWVMLSMRSFPFGVNK